MGLRNLFIPEAFITMAELVAQRGSIAAGECLVDFLLKQPERCVKEWPSHTWIKLRQIAFIPCHVCHGSVPPALEPSECHNLASHLASLVRLWKGQCWCQQSQQRSCYRSSYGERCVF